MIWIKTYEMDPLNKDQHALVISIHYTKMKDPNYDFYLHQISKNTELIHIGCIETEIIKDIFDYMSYTMFNSRRLVES